MNIALVVSSYSPVPGGVESHVRHLAENLADRGHDVTVVTHALAPGTADREFLNRVRVVRLALTVRARNYRFSLPLWRYLRASSADFDVVHVHSYHTVLPLMVAAAGPSTAVFTPHYHGVGHTPFRALLHQPYRWVARRAVRRMAAIICVSKAEASHFLRDFPEMKDRVATVYNGTDLRAASPEALDATPVTSADVLFVGRLEAYKGVGSIIRSLPFARPGTRLVVIGQGPARAPLLSLAEDVGVADRVAFLGAVTDSELLAATARAGALCTMSEQEAFGLTIADAVTQGLPVVASDIPAHAEVAELAGSAGRIELVDLDASPEVLAAKIAEGIGAGRSLPSAVMPSWSQVAERTEGVYAQALAAGVPRPATS